MRSVPTSTPLTALITHSAPSAAESPASASPSKSSAPGVSMKLILLSIHSANAQPQGNGKAPLDLLGEVIGQGRAVAHLAVSFAVAGREAEGVHETGLAAAAVADHGHVPDTFAVVLPHRPSEGAMSSTAR